jgi:hypothetical protein
MGLITVVSCLLMVLAAAIAQPAVAHCLTLGGVYPDLAVAAILVCAMVLGAPEGVGMALIAALIAVTQVGHIGIAGVMISRCTVGAVGGVTGARLYRTSVLVQMGAAFVAVLASDTVLFLFTPDALVGRWLGYTLGKALLTALSAPLLFGFVHRVAAWESGDRYRYLPLR